MAIMRGVFTRKIFANWEGGFHIYSFKPLGRLEETVVYYGDRPPVIDDKDCIIKGYKKRSPKYGLQFVLKTVDDAEEYEQKRNFHIGNLYELLM